MDALLRSAAESWGVTQHLTATMFDSVLSPALRMVRAGPSGGGVWDKSHLPSSTVAQDPIVDVLVYLELTLASLVLLVLFRHTVAQPLGRLVLPGSPTDAAVRKFGDSCVECANYATFTVIGTSIVFTSGWAWPSSSWWEGEGDAAATLMRDDLRCWYILDASRYSAALISLLFLEHRRKDFAEMFVHHIATILVTLVSYSLGFTRLGAMVKLVMDPADVPLHTAKMFLYISGEDTKSWAYFIADRIFEVFAVTFFVTRLICYGYVVYVAAECPWNACTPYFAGGASPAAWTCVGLLVVLLGLQIFWMSMLLKMVIKKLRGERLNPSAL